MGNHILPQEQSSLGVSIRLLKDYQSGDADALNKLLKRISPRILLSVRSRRDRKLRSKLDSMDILQEVMQDALPRLKTLEIASEGGLIHWFSVVVSRHIANQAEYFNRDKRSISKEVPLDSSFGSDSGEVVLRAEPRSSELSPSGELIVTEKIRLVEDALEKLPPDYQEVIRQRNIEGLGYDEIGVLMDRNADTVKRLYSRAVARLAVELKEAGGI